jgi:putative hemolysin
MLADISLLFVLILINGLFALSEIAIIGSRRVRLQQMAEQGSGGAAVALQLGEQPTRFLSTVQVGITSIGIMSGAIGEATISERLTAAVQRIPMAAAHADTIAFVIMVVGLTYVSLIAGELVPKRLALTRPETLASIIARPMRIVSAVVRPLVYLLSVSTDTVLRIMRVKHVKQPAVTLEEFRVLVDQGTQEGVFEKTEQELVSNVLRLDERRVGAIMTPRADIVFLDARATFGENRTVLTSHPHTVLPLCDGSLERVFGFVKATDVLVRMLRGESVDLRRLASPPLFVPATTTIMRLLEQFRRTHLPLALVIDEHGGVAGLISFADVVGAIVGDLPPEPGEDPMIVHRGDGSWLLDGAFDLDALRRLLGDTSYASDAGAYYHTVAGLAMLVLGRIPRTGDVFEKEGVRFEIVDMDGNRVDKLLVIPPPPPAEPTPPPQKGA